MDMTNVILSRSVASYQAAINRKGAEAKNLTPSEVAGVHSGQGRFFTSFRMTFNGPECS